MNGLLDRHLAVVTGGASGIGRAIAIWLKSGVVQARS